MHASSTVTEVDGVVVCMCVWEKVGAICFCFTPSEPGQLYQGERERESEKERESVRETDSDSNNTDTLMHVY